MKRADQKDKNLIIRLLTKSFEDNKSVNYIIRQDKKKIQRINALIDYSFEVCLRFGEVWLSDDHKACALVLYPHRRKTSFSSVWLDVKFIFKAVGIQNISKTLKLEALIKNKQPRIKMAYLWFIGVDVMYQHSGIGSRLLKEILVHTGQNELPVYLRTSTLKNVPLYERLGFQIYDQLEFSYPLYFLKYEPAK